MAARPRRQNKGDRLLSPGASPDQIACDYAVAPFDRAATEAERRWGIDRLPEVVSPALAARYGRAVAILNAAIEAGDAAQVAEAAANCIKGIAAMEREATSTGAVPLPAKVIEIEFDGIKSAIVQDARDMQFYKRRADVIVYTAREIAVAMQALARHDGMMTETKRQFGNAQITDIRPRLPEAFWERGDTIPF